MTSPVTTCPEITVGYDVILKADRVWTCGQRIGHLGPHNERAPRDWRTMREAGCDHTSWEDHGIAGACPDTSTPYPPAEETK